MPVDKVLFNEVIQEIQNKLDNGNTTMMKNGAIVVHINRSNVDKKMKREICSYFKDLGPFANCEYNSKGNDIKFMFQTKKDGGLYFGIEGVPKSDWKKITRDEYEEEQSMYPEPEPIDFKESLTEDEINEIKEFIFDKNEISSKVQKLRYGETHKILARFIRGQLEMGRFTVSKDNHDMFVQVETDDLISDDIIQSVCTAYKTYGGYTEVEFTKGLQDTKEGRNLVLFHFSY